ncbi:MAG TPA: ABC transporter ATP-binding protein [Acidimicrobiia bacterium]|nr:ABC transporter ATP-binding protein [Acidimicrobiia bacterium]
MSEPAPIIAVSGLQFAYGELLAIDGIDLTVPPGRIGLVGANGAGKTTLLKILLGVLPARSGSVQVLGHDVASATLEVRSRVGWMPEGDCLPPDQTAADFLGYAAELGGLPTRAARQRASDMLGLVGLDEERFRFIGEFSTGMKQRAKLAQAIVHDPQLVLLDEPTAGLDPEGREEMLDLITRLEGFGINAVISSHVLTDIERTCEWVVMLDGGKVLRSGPLSDLATFDEAELEVIGDAEGVIAAATRLGADVHRHGPSLVISRPGGNAFDVARDAVVSAGAAIRRLGARRTTLEDVFLGEEDSRG